MSDPLERRTLGLNDQLALYEMENQLPAGSAYPSHLGVFCDECEITLEGDFIVHEGLGKEERLKLIRDHAVTAYHWSCEDGEDLCGNCRDGADPMILHAPWSKEEVQVLNVSQGNVKIHPFTCGRNHSTSRILKATQDGWVCPESDCDYTQKWALRAMAKFIHLKGCPDHGFDCEPDDHIEPPTVGGEVI